MCVCFKTCWKNPEVRVHSSFAMFNGRDKTRLATCKPYLYVLNLACTRETLLVRITVGDVVLEEVLIPWLLQHNLSQMKDVSVSSEIILSDAGLIAQMTSPQLSCFMPHKQR